MAMFYLLLLLSSLAGLDGQRALYRRLMRTEKEIRHSQDLLNRLVDLILPNFHCLQVYTDGTIFANSFLQKLHRAGGIVPMILGVEWSDITACKGFILLAENYFNAKALLEAVPRYAEHRILLILQGPPIVLNEVVMGGPEIFLDSDTLMVASGNFTTGFYMAQPKRNFTKFSKLRLWKYSDQGVKNYLGREIQFLTYNCSMFSHLGPVLSNGTPAWISGVEIELISEIAERLNLVPQFIPSQRPKSARTLWYQKALMDRRAKGADMAFCGILMSSKKMNKDVIMSVPLTLVCLKRLVPRPKEVATEWDGIFEPFEPELWFSIGMCVFGMSFVFQRMAISSTKYTRTKNVQKYEGLGVSFIQTLSILVMTNIPRSTSKQGPLRHLITWWAMFTLVLTTCYSSGLITHLTNQEFHTIPGTFTALVHGKYSWAMASTPDFRELINTHDELQMAWRQRFKLLKSAEEHAALLQRDKKQTLWGYHVHGGFTLPDYELPDHVIDRFETSAGCFMEYFMGYAIREGCPFENPINQYIQAYNEAGLVRYLFQKIYRERSKKHKYTFKVMRPTKGRLGDPKGLRIKHLLGIFLVWGLGAALSILIFLLELAQKCWI